MTVTLGGSKTSPIYEFVLEKYIINCTEVVFKETPIFTETQAFQPWVRFRTAEFKKTVATTLYLAMKVLFYCLPLAKELYIYNLF